MATFICSAIGSPNPTIEWRKNGRRLITQRYSVIDFPSGSVLRIEPVKSVSLAYLFICFGLLLLTLFDTSIKSVIDT